MDKTNKESYIPKVLALVSFCTVFGLILVSVITDLVIFKDFILTFIGGMIITGVVFIILFIGFVLSILLVFGVGIVKDSGFWPLSISISLSKEILDDVYMSEDQIRTFIVLRIAIIIMLISMFILAIVANIMHKRRIKENDPNIRKIKPFTVVAIVYSILAIAIGFGMILIVQGVGPSV